MLQKFIHRLIKPRHYWRNIGFDELSELYTSMMFRTLAQSIVGIFIPIYLYRLGYEIPTILLFFGQMFIFWKLSAIVSAWIVARIGPKHSMLASHFLIVAAMAMLTSLGSMHWPLLLIALFLGSSNGLFFLAFHVDFSKVKHSEHGGKEVGWMFIMQKAGIALGPITGGIVAYMFGSEYIFLASTVLLVLSAVPLFTTAEPTRTHQHIDFSSLSLKDTRRDIFSHAAMGIENVISIIVWPFFIALVVFQDNPYLSLGIVMSASMVAAFIASRTIGAMIDDRRGRRLLRIGAILNAVLHLFRPFVKNFSTAFGINLLGEGLSSMYRMPYTKGMYDAADDYPGRRIVYMCAMEATAAFGRAIFFMLAALLAYLISDVRQLFGILFIVGAAASLMIMTERFRALGRIVDN